MSMNYLLYIHNFTDEEIKKAFGKSLKELRLHLGITQKELSKSSGVSVQSLSVYERGDNVPTITQAIRLTYYFNLSIDDLIIYGLSMQNHVLQENFATITEKYDFENKS